MPLIKDAIRRFFPDGTNFSPTTSPPVPDESKWSLVPSWPPDLFAIASKLVDWSGCYSGARYVGWDAERLFSRDRYCDYMEKIADEWRSGQNPEELQKIWENLVQHQDSEICQHSAENQPWMDAAITLMAIADHASAGIGFVGEPSLFPDLLLRNYTLYADGHVAEMDLKYLPHSICAMVPSKEACVQPKTMTPRPGCTLRSFSHHLALLPPVSEVATSWLFSIHEGINEEGPLNLLLVPFPYTVEDGCITEGTIVDGPSRYGFFEMNQLWLCSGGADVTADQISDFLIDLIREAESRCVVVNGLVMPELALDKERAQAVSEILARRTNLELFVSGIATRDADRRNPRNRVYASFFADHAVLSQWEQAKNHRWMLEDSQIRRYRVEDVLDPAMNWWEQIIINPRACEFRVFRKSASLAFLICEDLARIDPVQTVIRAVGPNCNGSA